MIVPTIEDERAVGVADETETSLIWGRYASH